MTKTRETQRSSLSGGQETTGPWPLVPARVPVCYTSAIYPD